MTFEVDGLPERDFVIRLSAEPDYRVFYDASAWQGKTLRIRFEGDAAGLDKRTAPSYSFAPEREQTATCCGRPLRRRIMPSRDQADGGDASVASLPALRRDGDGDGRDNRLAAGRLELDAVNGNLRIKFEQPRIPVERRIIRFRKAPR
jgi:hypothetical protein